MASHAQVLFIDAYDSFSNNIIALVQTHLPVQITKIYIDTAIPDFISFLAPFAAVICGPGPGHPGNFREVGLFRKVWDLDDAYTIPVLGICLGFQSLVFEQGGTVEPLAQPRHGVETFVTSSSASIFKGLPQVCAVQYHSLHAILGHAGRGEDDEALWKPSTTCPNLTPLAWDFGKGVQNDPNFQQNPEKILMAVKHITKPYYGIQFHPESICSQGTARQVVSNWWYAAVGWLQHSPNKSNKLQFDTAIHSRNMASESNPTCPSLFNRKPSPPVCTSAALLPPLAIGLSEQTTPRVFISSTIEAGTLTVPDIYKALNPRNDEIVILDSEMRQLRSLGEASIIGFIEPTTRIISYSIGTKFAIWKQGDKETHVPLDTFDGDFFAYLKELMEREAITSAGNRTFCGGLMGYVTYEACLERIGLSAMKTTRHPDICFAFIERSIVIDHREKLVHVQSIKLDDTYEGQNWTSKTLRMLGELQSTKTGHDLDSMKDATAYPDNIRCSQPSEVCYKKKIRECQEQIRAGNSYELCLTDQTEVQFDNQHSCKVSSWDRYQSLRRLNPAPFAAYLKLGPLTLLSTSPERFMCWTKFQSYSSAQGAKPISESTCQFRPIKGTVKKQQELKDGKIQDVTLAQATAILSTQKERAENLMIVDLIRHDLYGVTSFQNVIAKGLMVIEEYASVYQLVSVIEGKLLLPSRPSHSVAPIHLDRTKTGIDVLAASLPPGSMTGAPKRRSCELLQEIERFKPRSIYSGVLGYMCVSGKGDFSVVIRSIFKWEDGDKEVWNIGAGGAVTALSTEEGEWEEMLVKLQSTLLPFTKSV